GDKSSAGLCGSCLINKEIPIMKSFRNSLVFSALVLLASVAAHAELIQSMIFSFTTSGVRSSRLLMVETGNVGYWFTASGTNGFRVAARNGAGNQVAYRFMSNEGTVAFTLTGDLPAVVARQLTECLMLAAVSR